MNGNGKCKSDNNDWEYENNSNHSTACTCGHEMLDHAYAQGYMNTLTIGRCNFCGCESYAMYVVEDS